MGVKFYRGTIVLVLNVPDQAGRNPKDRPVVLIRDFCDDDEFAFGVAITGEFDFPLPNTSIALSFNQDGNSSFNAYSLVFAGRWYIERGTFAGGTRGASRAR